MAEHKLRSKKITSNSILSQLGKDEGGETPQEDDDLNGLLDDMLAGREPGTAPNDQSVEMPDADSPPANDTEPVPDIENAASAVDAGDEDIDLSPPKMDESRVGRGLTGVVKKNLGALSEEDQEAFNERIRMSAQEARIIMNRLRVMGPVLKRVIGNADSDDAASLASDLLSRSEQLQHKLYPLFNARQEKEVPHWLQAMVARYATTMICDNPSLSVEDVFAMSKELAAMQQDVQLNFDPEYDDKVQLRISLMRSVSRIELDLNDFIQKLTDVGELDMASKMRESRPQFLTEMSDFIVEKARGGLYKLCNKDTTRRSMAQMSQSLIDTATDFYLAAFNSEVSTFWQRRGQSDRKEQAKNFAQKFSHRKNGPVTSDAVTKRAASDFEDMLDASMREFDKQYDRLITFAYDKIKASSNKV